MQAITEGLLKISVNQPLFKLLGKDVTFHWDFNCQVAFEKVKGKLYIAPVLRGPNWALPFHISTDASETVVRASLGKK